MSPRRRRASIADTTPRAPALYRVLRAVLTPVVGAAFRPSVTGLALLPDRGPAIVCANHLSNIDPVIIPIVCPHPIFYLGKSEYFQDKRRWFFESVGVMPVAREGGTAGERSLARGRELLDAGAWLGIFPEGTRSPDGRLHRGRTGPARLAARTGAPIVPVGIIGTREALPPHARLPRPRRVSVHFGAPMRFAGLRDDDHAAVRAATESLMHRILRLSGQEYVDRYASDPHARPERGHHRPLTGDDGDQRRDVS